MFAFRKLQLALRVPVSARDRVQKKDPQLDEAIRVILEELPAETKGE